MNNAFPFNLRLVYAFAVLSVLSLTVPGQTGPQLSDQQIAQRIKQGIEHAKRGQFKATQRAFNDVLAQPDNGIVHNNPGNSYLLEGKYASAMQEYWKVLQQQPVDTRIYLNLGIVYYLQMESTKEKVDTGYEDSKVPKENWDALWRAAFAKTLEPTQGEQRPLSDEDIAQEITRGRKYVKREQFEKAEQAFKKVLAQQPENAIARNNLANGYLLEGKYASAMQEYWRALQYDSADPGIYLNLGIVCHRQMANTKDKVSIGNEESTVPQQNWRELSQSAFDEAYQTIPSVTDACHFLGIPPVEDLRYRWIQKLLYEAAARNKKLLNLRSTGGTRKNEWRIAVYWKE